MYIGLAGILALRARASAIRSLLPMYPGSKRFLRSGAIPGDCKEDFKRLKKQALQGLSDKQGSEIKPLTFVELCSFNTWFEIHPEKIAGKEVLMTSKAFPVSIKGTKEDIVKTINMTLKGWGIQPGQDNRPVRFSFTASNITVYDAKSNDILAQSVHNGRSLTRLLKKFPNFSDRLGMYGRLTGYYLDIPLSERLSYFKKDAENIPNFPGNKVLEFQSQNRLSEYLDRFGDRSKTPIGRTTITLRTGEVYSWTNKAESEIIGKKQVPLRYEMTGPASSGTKQVRVARAKAEAKLKLLKLLKT
jgi:hypothetical protein